MIDTRGSPRRNIYFKLRGPTPADVGCQDLLLWMHCDGDAERAIGTTLLR